MKCTGPKIAIAFAHLIAACGFICYVVGWGLELGYIAQIASGAAAEAGAGLGVNFLSSMTDHNSSNFVDYIFIVVAVIALVIKLFHSCCVNRWLGLATIVACSASTAVAGFIAGPQGSAFITCVSSSSTNMTNTEKQLADCVAGENNMNIALMFFGTTIYIIAVTIVVGMMYFQAQTSLNAVSPNTVAEGGKQVWA